MNDFIVLCTARIHGTLGVSKRLKTAAFRSHEWMEMPTESNNHTSPEKENPRKKERWTRYVPGFLREYANIWREQGFRALLKQKGWKVVLVIVVYYLIRDSILYILIPYLIARGLMDSI